MSRVFQPFSSTNSEITHGNPHGNAYNASGRARKSSGGCVMATSGRKASVRYYASRGAYFTHFEGDQIRLSVGPDDAPNGPTYLAALDAFRQLMQVNTADSDDQANTVRVVVDLYGQHLER